MNIYLHELRALGKNTLLWIASLSAATLFLFSMFPAFSENADAIGEALQNYPLPIRLAFGLMIDQIGSVLGFHSFTLTVLTLVGAVQAMSLGLTVLARETTSKTADFLLTKPVARGRIAAAKLLAAMTCAALTGGTYVLVSAGAASAVRGAQFDMKPFLMMSLTLPFVQFIFLALGYAAAAVVPKIRSVLPVALGTVFGFFILGTVAAMLDLTPLYYLSPFKYFDTYYILLTSSYRPGFALTGALAVLVLAAAGFMVYTRRDVRAA